ncbi:hydantoinase/oxoprolinase family protein [Streptomyces sp. NRRL S-1868]|uniref:hydantoinase/oxoprolinase family protein n=1 Tax=Streptomyces sp. NRRL S-1868 TaxID=1463892 RepID=UPI0004C694F8|nr:hydantoinase/oxoprolinase family protein [Streptomyces sp. NRRL S-1868]
MKELRIGIDVGGTNTDVAVVHQDGDVLAWHKAPTSPDVFEGIRAALVGVLSEVDGTAVGQVMLGTTHPVNAIIRRSGLGRVALLRIGAPATRAIPPFAEWPEDLVDVVRGPVEIVRGGHDVDGRVFVPLDGEAVTKFAEQCRDVDGVAVVAMNSPINADQELQAVAILRGVLGEDAMITASHEVSGLGLLERENSAILNSALVDVARTARDGLTGALADHGITAEMFFTQNDGTLMTADEAVRRPVMTIGSGPTNSMRGAAYLSGVDNAIVMDVGGTSTDVGLLVDGFPRESALAVEVGGVRTNYRMADLISVGIGGGTIVGSTSPPQVGPDSVGYRITEEALVYGGNTLTLSDISVASRRAQFGDPSLVSLTDDSVEEVLAHVDEQFGILADRIKTSRGELPLIAVGGGAHLIPDAIPGVSKVIRHDLSPVANAVGAAIAEASGTVDRVYSYDEHGREKCLNEAREAATAEAVRAGADPNQVRITRISEIPMTYVPGGSVRVAVKAVGQLLRSAAVR